jgi:hypothetical protein
MVNNEIEGRREKQLCIGWDTASAYAWRGWGKPWKTSVRKVRHGDRPCRSWSSRWLPIAAAQVRVRSGMWGLWWTKRHWGRFSPSTSVSPANHHPTNFSIIIITWGWHNRPINDRSVEWTQLDSTPPLYQFKKKGMEMILQFNPFALHLICLFFSEIMHWV